jgi:hypothetical protein
MPEKSPLLLFKPMFKGLGQSTAFLLGSPWFWGCYGGSAASPSLMT